MQHKSTYVYRSHLKIRPAANEFSDDAFDMDALMELLQARKDQDDVPINRFKFKIEANDDEEDLYYLEPMLI